jgi:hypothetical protein
MLLTTIPLPWVFSYLSKHSSVSTEGFYPLLKCWCSSSICLSSTSRATQVSRSMSSIPVPSFISHKPMLLKSLSPPPLPPLSCRPQSPVQWIPLVRSETHLVQNQLHLPPHTGCSLHSSTSAKWPLYLLSFPS